MDTAAVIARLRDIMQKSCPEKRDWSAVDSSAVIRDLGFDSLTVLDLLYDVQHAFNIELDLDELADATTVDDLAKLIRQQTAE